MKKFFGSWLMLLVVVSCSGPRNVSGSRDDGKISVNFILINDVYEIAPLSGGREGGLARIATLKKEYLAKNPNTFLMVAGDFLSPSVYHSLRYEGKPIRGRQMVEAMNAAGVDMAAFGNHEFDIRENELQERLNESSFEWISSNVLHRKGQQLEPFAKTGGEDFPTAKILTVKDSDGTMARIGIIALCLPFNRAEYVHYEDPLSTAKKMYNRIVDSVDAVVALTHQHIKDDIQLAKELPGLAMILGGHEHDQRFEKVGKVYITKSMANAKSAYVVELNINKKKKKFSVDPDLEVINQRIALDSATHAVVKKWTAVAESSFATLGFNAQRVVLEAGEPLEGRETVIRSQPTNLSQLVVSGMQAAIPGADAVIFNSGSIRVDDELQMPVTEYDIIRTLPFGGSIREVDMKGSLLLQVLDQGEKNRGTGGFLVHNVQGSKGNWKLNHAPIAPDKIYHVAFSEFLLTGKEVNLEFLHPDNKGIVKLYPVPAAGSAAADIRHALIRYLTKK